MSEFSYEVRHALCGGIAHELDGIGEVDTIGTSILEGLDDEQAERIEYGSEIFCAELSPLIDPKTGRFPAEVFPIYADRRQAAIAQLPDFSVHEIDRSEVYGIATAEALVAEQHKIALREQREQYDC